ncbi:hypothetical protein H5410_030923, partial [Solanum commersonii]
SGADSWYERVERSRNLMRRIKISLKVLKWLVAVFIEASGVHGNTIKRWRMKDHFSEFFCTLKYNENGRYISFIAIQERTQQIQTSTVPKLTSSFKEACSNNRWTTDASKKALLHTNHDNIRIVGGSAAGEKDLLSRGNTGTANSK